MDWQAFLFDAEHQRIARLEYFSRRRFHDPILADQAFEFALARLQENDFARLNTFAQKCSPDTFLTLVFKRLLEDFAIQKFGKCRAPVWVQALGAVWQRLYKRLCCERRDLTLLAQQWTESAHSAEQILHIGRTIKARIPNCGASLAFVSLSSTPDEATLDAVDENAAEPSSTLEQHSHETLLAHIAAALNFETRTETVDPTLVRALQDALDADTHLLLKMVFQDELSVAKAALILGLAEHTARRKIKACLADLKRLLTEAGFDHDV